MIRDQPNTKEEITEALSYIDPDICYSDWLKVGMALHDWQEDEGLDIWDGWSKQGEKYDGDCCYRKWNNFTKGGITIATLFHFAKEEGWEYSKEESIYMKPNEIDPFDLPCLAIPERNISELVCKVYDVHSSVSEEDGKTIHCSYFPVKRNEKIVGFKIKDRITEDKKKRYPPDIGNTKGKKEFFGQDVAKRCRGKKLVICEGQDDALAMTECLIKHTKKEYVNYKPGVVGVTDGAGSLVNMCTENRGFIERFEEIIIAFDPDEEGRKATEKCLKTFPMFKVAELPDSLDVNDMWKAGRGEELYNLVVWKAKTKRQGQVVDIADILEEALIRPEKGLDFPWHTVTKLTYGIRPHTIHIIGAAPKIGKSDHEYQLIHHIAYNLKQTVGVFDLENPPKKTVKKIASKEAGVDFTKPGAQYKDEDLREFLTQLNGKVKMYDRGASRDWIDIRIAIEEMYLLDGIRIFTLDPITALISRYKASDANDLLNEICTDMADLVQKYPITIFNYSHVNPKPKGTKSHEDGARVLSSEFTGSRAMEKWFHYGWGIRRNRSPDCPPEEQNISHLDLLFDRDFGNSGTVTLFFDKDNMSYLEV